MEGNMLLICYLLSVILVPAVFVTFYFDTETPLRISDPGEVVQSLFFCFLWPIFVPVIVAVNLVKYRKDRFEKRVADIIGHYRLEGVSPHDRTVMVVIPEADLKFLLSNYRRKKIKLKPQMVEIIREELMHRNAEKHLLR